MQYELFKTAQAGGKSWFVTLTIRPEWRARLDKQVSETTYEARCTVVLQWVRDYLKRLRAALSALDGCKVRFVAVTEPHYDGFPHVHMVLHGGPDLTYRMLRLGRWKHGFIHAQLADQNAARYLTKYLTKQVGYVRASIRYGVPLSLDALPHDSGDAVDSASGTTTHDEGRTSCCPGGEGLDAPSPHQALDPPESSD